MRQTLSPTVDPMRPDRASARRPTLARRPMPAQRPTPARAAVLVALMSAVLPAGCQKTVTPVGPEPIVRTNNGNAGGNPDVVMPGDGPTASIPFDATDPCDANLHELSGLLLEHWLVNRRLPRSLDDLRPLADPGQANAFTCPFAKRSYTYLPQAAQMMGTTPRLVVYAPAAGPDGRHRAILMRVPSGSLQPATWVVKLTQIELQGQLGSMPAPTAAAPSTRPAQ